MRHLTNTPLIKRQCAYLLGWHQHIGYDENKENQYPIIHKDDIIEKYEIQFQNVK